MGTLVVVPRAGLKASIDQSAWTQAEDLDASLRATLQEIFSLPLASEVRDPLPTDLGLDVFIPSFQSGDFWSASLGDVGVPVFWLFFWRPKVTVTGRLYDLTSQKTKWTYSVTRKMPWREFANRMLTWRAVFRFRPMFGAEDLNHLLCLACHSLLHKLTKFV